MNKDLININKIDNPDQREETARPAAAGAAHSVGAYRPELSAEAWKHDRQPWNASPQGRLAIRMFSRGILGAAFFAGGGILNGKWMKGYDKEASWGEQTENPLKFISKLIDTVAGKPITATVNALGGNGAKAVRFRPSRYHSTTTPGVGHSLGEETVAVTFDFFCASIGDAFGRDIAGWFDPSVKKKWIKDGHVDFPETVRSMVKSVWRYFTYNGGEDWAVAIPYVYFMRAQRAALNHASHGFRYDSDRQGNGGTFRVNDNLNLVGNYNQEGILDLQNRFVVYNMGTLMYRELYDAAAHMLSGHKACLYGSPDKKSASKGLLSGVGTAIKWMARSAVKGAIYMTPAVPFFWITRTPQSKWRGQFVHPEEGMLAYREQYRDADGQVKTRTNIIHANEHTKGTGYGPDTPLFYAKYDYKHNHFEPLKPTGRTAGETGFGLHGFDPHGQTFGIIDRGLNAIGEANYRVSEYAATVPAGWADKNLGWFGAKAKSFLGAPDFSRFGRDFVNASVSYTPYMYAKAEFARVWDDGKMDMAAERMIDGAAKLSWGEFKAGAGEVWNTFLHRQLADPAREAEGQRRIALDLSPPDDADHLRREENNPLSWLERVIQGKPEDKPEVGGNNPKNYAEREEMRKALEKMHPPTNSIN